MRTAFIVSAFAFVVPALGAPTVIPITKHAGPVKPDSYIIKFKDSAAPLTKLLEKLRESDSSITYNYAPFWNGCAATLRGDNLEFVQQMGGIEYIEQDGIVSLVEHEIDSFNFADPPAMEPHDPMIARGSGDGSGVTIYGIDTGVYTEHHDFGGRASHGANFVQDESDNDGNGHGTHTAGTAIGNKYGMAKSADFIAVKVLDSSGSGPTSAVIAGVQWACDNSKSKAGLAIATMSLGGAPSQSMDDAVSTGIKGGLHFTIAAGNSYLPADTSSPARVEAANTIGAVDANNQKADFSNWGELIDVWALGVNVMSTWNTGPDSTNTLSGTSMATPCVAGILAIALGEYGKMSPAALSDALKTNAASIVTFSLLDTGAKATSNNLLAKTW